MSTETEFDPEPIVGPVAAEEYRNAPGYAKDKLREWIERLPALSDRELQDEAEGAILASAIMQRFRGNNEDYHCKGTATYYQSKQRMVRDGHTEHCGPSPYTRAYRQATLSQGYDWPDRSICHCDEGER